MTPHIYSSPAGSDAHGHRHGPSRGDRRTVQVIGSLEKFIQCHEGCCEGWLHGVFVIQDQVVGLFLANPYARSDCTFFPDLFASPKNRRTRVEYDRYYLERTESRHRETTGREMALDYTPAVVPTVGQVVSVALQMSTFGVVCVCLSE